AGSRRDRAADRRRRQHSPRVGAGARAAPAAGAWHVRRACHRSQRGVALIVALLVLALATVLIAAIIDDGESALARTRNALRAEQTWQLHLGLEAWAGLMLRRDEEQRPGVDTFDDFWAQPLPPIEVPGGRVQGRLRD